MQNKDKYISQSLELYFKYIPVGLMHILHKNNQAPIIETLIVSSNWKLLEFMKIPAVIRE